MGVGLAAELIGLHRRGCLKGKTETQSWLWAMAGVAMVGETLSLTQEFLEKCTGDEQASCTVPSLAPPPQAGSAAKRVALTQWIPKAPPSYNLSAVPRQRNMDHMKEQRKASERELSEEEIANLSDGEFKSLVIKIFTQLIELGWKMKKTNEGYLKWNKAKYPGNQQWQEGNQGSKQWLGTKGRNKHPTGTERRTRTEERLRNLWDNLKHSNIQIIGVP